METNDPVKLNAAVFKRAAAVSGGPVPSLRRKFVGMPETMIATNRPTKAARAVLMGAGEIA
jgi:hypothetical protein